MSEHEYPDPAEEEIARMMDDELLIREEEEYFFKEMFDFNLMDSSVAQYMQASELLCSLLLFSFDSGEQDETEVYDLLVMISRVKESAMESVKACIGDSSLCESIKPQARSFPKGMKLDPFTALESDRADSLLAISIANLKLIMSKIEYDESGSEEMKTGLMEKLLCQTKTCLLSTRLMELLGKADEKMIDEMKSLLEQTVRIISKKSFLDEEQITKMITDDLL